MPKVLIVSSVKVIGFMINENDIVMSGAGRHDCPSVKTQDDPLLSGLSLALSQGNIVWGTMSSTSPRCSRVLAKAPHAH